MDDDCKLDAAIEPWSTARLYASLIHRSSQVRRPTGGRLRKFHAFNLFIRMIFPKGDCVLPSALVCAVAADHRMYPCTTCLASSHTGLGSALCYPTLGRFVYSHITVPPYISSIIRFRSLQQLPLRWVFDFLSKESPPIIFGTSILNSSLQTCSYHLHINLYRIDHHHRSRQRERRRMKSLNAHFATGVLDRDGVTG